MPRHAHSNHTSHRHGSRAGHAGANRRGPRRGPRIVFALCCTALAAGAGGVLSGELPLPPGVPASVVVAGDPGGRTAVAHRSGSADSDTAEPNGSGTGSGAGAGSGIGGAGTTAGSGVRPSATAKPTPTATPSATAKPSAVVTTHRADPSPSKATPAASAVTQDVAMVADDQAQILSLVNTQRAKAGCGALTASKALTTLAQNFSEEMAVRNFFDHTDPDGKSPWDRAKALGITNLGGENIAMGQQTPADVMNAWMNSPGHRANILNCTYHSLGVGAYYAPTGGPWWTQDFGF
jgi:uncharacterized protein YkwD